MLCDVVGVDELHGEVEALAIGVGDGDRGLRRLAHPRTPHCPKVLAANPVETKIQKYMLNISTNLRYVASLGGRTQGWSGARG
jgi:hypothetical protein